VGEDGLTWTSLVWMCCLESDCDCIVRSEVLLSPATVKQKVRAYTRMELSGESETVEKFVY
jgi:hypothetical protein